MARPWLATDTVRFVGEPVAVIVAERRGGRPRTRPSWCSSTTTRCRRSSTRSRPRRTRCSCSPSTAPTCALEMPFGHTGDELFDGLRGRRRPDDHQPARRRVPARAAGDGGDLARRAPRHFWSHPGTPTAVKAQARRAVRPRARAGARDRARRRRRLRRQDRRPGRRGAAAVAGPPAGPAGALGRDPRREHGGHGPRPGPGPAASRSAAAATAPSRPTGSPSCRTPAPTRAMGAVLPFLTRMMAQGTYAIPKVECNIKAVDHQHHPDRGLPRRRSARGHRRDRAGHRPVRRRDRHGPGRGAPQEPDPGRRVPVHDADRRHLRLRRLRAGASTSRSRPPATTTLRAEQAAPARRRRRRPARHRRVDLRRGHRRPAPGRASSPRSCVQPDGTATVYTGIVGRTGRATAPPGP